MNSIRKVFNRKKIAVSMAAALVLFALPAVLFAASGQGTFNDGSSAELDGRTVADKGSRVTVSGTLLYKDSEWYLQSGDNVYDLHLGLYGHDENMTGTMNAGESAKVEGFMLENHIAPVSIVSGGETYNFRDKSGNPLWAGKGVRRNAVK